jgi:hypothetical protein
MDIEPREEYSSGELPTLYHSASISFIKNEGLNRFYGMFTAMTDKPLYGGTRSYMGMAMYTRNLIRGDHFSLSVGGGLVLMDTGILLPNDTPWMLWPLPMINLSWKYDWFTYNFSLFPGSKLHIGYNFPFSLILQVSTTLRFDFSLWYRIFKEENPNAERIGFGIGTKREYNSVTVSDGGRYGISYYAVYGALRFFKYLEFQGGWAFGGNETYNKLDFNELPRRETGISSNAGNSNFTGNGFFLQATFRIGR